MTTNHAIQSVRMILPEKPVRGIDFATPLTAMARAQWGAVKTTHASGFPYSEGIYEDLTKVVYSQFYWNDRPVEETVKEYIAFEFSPDVVEDVAGVVDTLNHTK